MLHSRVCIFASYDKHNIIHPYVIAYLKKIKRHCDKIIFIADNSATSTEQDKLKKLVDYAQFERHGEYDFGSYKRGFAWLQKQPYYNDVTELILCNDSCFTVGDFQDVFNTMANNDADFWGMTYNIYGNHVQSYFWVLKKSVFTSQTFHSFIFSVKKEKTFLDIVYNYEVAFTPLLDANGFSVSSYTPPMALPHQHPLITLKQGNPLVKRKGFIPPKYDLWDVCLDNPFKLLSLIKKISPLDYTFIQEYHAEPLFWICAKLHFIRNLFTFLHKVVPFFYKKKRTQSGKIIIKICKIPVYRGK